MINVCNQEIKEIVLNVYFYWWSYISHDDFGLQTSFEIVMENGHQHSGQANKVSRSFFFLSSTCFTSFFRQSSTGVYQAFRYFLQRSFGWASVALKAYSYARVLEFDRICFLLWQIPAHCCRGLRGQTNRKIDMIAHFDVVKNDTHKSNKKYIKHNFNKMLRVLKQCLTKGWTSSQGKIL